MNYSTLLVPSHDSEVCQAEQAERSLYEHLQRVTDQRCLRGRRYEAATVLTLLVLAKMAGEEKVSGIAHWVKLRGGWLSAKLQIERGRLPCVNTYLYVMAHVDEQELDAELSAFMARDSPREGVTEEGVLQQVVIDGKVLRGTDRQSPVVQAPQMVVSAYHVQQRRVLKQVQAQSRGGEKQAANQLLSQLPVAGHLVSADALYTSPGWCRRARQQNGHYLLIAKGNRQELVEDIAVLFSDGPFPDLPEQRAQTVDKSHGRLETRRIRISSALTDYLKPGWPDVTQVFQVQRHVTRGARHSTEVAYGITSLSTAEASPRQVLQAVRWHWQIENVLHYRRDVTLGEDACLVSQGQTPRILALLNNAVLFLIDRSQDHSYAPAKIHEFAAFPEVALSLLLHPP